MKEKMAPYDEVYDKFIDNISFAKLNQSKKEEFVVQRKGPSINGVMVLGRGEGVKHFVTIVLMP